MKRFLLAIFLLVSITLTSCLENTQEVTINEDGTGTVKNTADMGGLIPLVKQFGGDKISELPEQKIDTTISLSKGADSIPDLNEKEKELMKTGTMTMLMDMPGEKMAFGLNFPIKSLDQVQEINSLSSKVLADAIKNQAGNGAAALGGQEMPKISSMDEYFITSFSPGLIEKKLNKEKYAGVDNDEFLTSMKQTSSMGLVVKNTYIYNLPRPVTKAEGKGVTLSADKKKVIIEADITDFFDEPGKFEYRIEY